MKMELRPDSTKSQIDFGLMSSPPRPARSRPMLEHRGRSRRTALAATKPWPIDDDRKKRRDRVHTLGM